MYPTSLNGQNGGEALGSVADIPVILLAGAHLWRHDTFESLCPRPLVPVLNIPLIRHLLRTLAAANLSRVVICANDAAELLRQELGAETPGGQQLYYYEDRVPRGPAGCVRDAAGLFDACHYLVIDASQVIRADLPALLLAHDTSEAIATVLVSAVRSNASAEYQPTGVYVLARAALARIPTTGFQDLKEMLLPLLHRTGQPVHAHCTTDPVLRINSLSSYLGVQEYLLGRLQPGEPQLDNYVRSGTAWVHVAARVHPDARLIGPVLVGPQSCIDGSAVVTGPTVIGRGCVLGPGTVVVRSVLWDGGRLDDNAAITQCLVSKNAHVPAGSRGLAQIIRRSQRLQPATRAAAL